MILVYNELHLEWNGRRVQAWGLKVVQNKGAAVSEWRNWKLGMLLSSNDLHVSAVNGTNRLALTVRCVAMGLAVG